MLLIHGTGAALEQSEGDAWWQAGSEFARQLECRLGGTFEVQPAASVFHWSGDNDGQARLEAAADLLEHLSALDRQLHVVAHSHGGSVLFESLLSSTEKGRKLPQVRSLITVGTPFIRPRLQPRWFFHGVSTLVALATLLLAVRPLWDILSSWSELMASGAMGSVVLLLFLVALLAGNGLAAALRLLGALDAKRRSRQRESLVAEARELFGDRWISYYTEADEAINGLRIAGDMTSAIVPRSAERGGSLAGRAVDAILWPIRAIYNHLVAPAGDEFIAAALENRAFGGHAIGSHRYDAAVDPPWGPGLAVSVPDEVARELESLADGALADTVVSLRQDLELVAGEDPRFATFTREAKQRLTFGELVHCSYFDSPGFTELLAATLRRTGESPAESSSLPAEPAAGRAGLTRAGRAHPVRPGLSGLLTLTRNALVATAAAILLFAYATTIVPYTPAYNRQLVAREFPWVDLLSYGDRRQYTFNSSEGEPYVDQTSCQPGSRPPSDEELWQHGRSGRPEAFLVDWFEKLERSSYFDAAEASLSRLLDEQGRPDRWQRALALRGMLRAAAMTADEPRVVALLEQQLANADPDEFRGGSASLAEWAQNVITGLVRDGDAAAAIWLEDVTVRYLQQRDPELEENPLRSWLVRALIQEGKLEQAEALAPDPEDRFVSSRLWSGRIRAGLYEQALITIDSIDYSSSNAWSWPFEQLILWLRKQGRHDEVPGVAEAALRATETGMRDKDPRGVGWRWLACSFARLGLAEQMAAALEHVPRYEPLLDVGMLASHLATAGAWHRDALLPRLQSLPENEWVLTEVAEKLAVARHLEEAVLLTESIEAADARQITLARILYRSAEEGDPGQALQILPIYLEATWQRMLAAIAEQYPADRPSIESQRDQIRSEAAAQIKAEMALYAARRPMAGEIQHIAENVTDLELRWLFYLEGARSRLRTDQTPEAHTLLELALQMALSNRAAIEEWNGLESLLAEDPWGDLQRLAVPVAWTVDGPRETRDLDQIEQILAAGRELGISWPVRLERTLRLLRIVRTARSGNLQGAQNALQALSSEATDTAVRMRAEAVIAAELMQAGRSEEAVELIESRPIEGTFESFDLPAWSAELFEMGLQEPVVRHFARALQDPDSGSISPFDQFAFRWLEQEPEVENASLVLTLLDEIKIERSSEAMRARLATLLLAKGRDDVGRQFARSLSSPGLRCVTLLLYLRATTRPSVRRGLMQELEATENEPRRAFASSNEQRQLMRASVRESALGEHPGSEAEIGDQLGDLLDQARSIGDPTLRSEVILEIARDYVWIGWLRSARIAANECLPGDRLRVLHSILAAPVRAGSLGDLTSADRWKGRGTQ